MENIVYFIFIIFLLLILLTFVVIYGLSIDKARKDFLATLNEHDLAIITKYNACCLFPFKKKGSKKQ